MKSFLKRSAVKQLACFLLAVIITVGFVPLPAQASTEKYKYKVTTLKQKKWVTAKEYNYNSDTNTSTYYLYRISVPANSFIRIDSKNKSKDYYYFYIFKSLNRNKPYYDQADYIDFYNENIYRQVLPKGTYYIYAEAGTTFKWQSAKTKNPTNFCRSRSTRLRAGYKKTEVFNIGYEFGRWYRISLTARKPITVTMKPMDSDREVDFTIYNSRGYTVTCNSLGNSNYRTAVLPKGTYYIRVFRDDDFLDYDDFGNRICQFWWR